MSSRMALARPLAALLLALAMADGVAGVWDPCNAADELDAAQQSRLLRFAALIKSELESSGHRIAIVSRSGLDLSRFGQRYSHAGIALRASANAPWSVRQLYYDCEQRQPRVFDQGMSGFVFGTRDPSIGHVSAVLLPDAASNALEQAVLDNGVALQLLGNRYSANAYAFAVRYQNCNQWVAEMLAVAWGRLDSSDRELRPAAQGWLRAQAYAPTAFDIDNPLLMLAGLAVPWLHSDDHPPAAPGHQRFVVSMPASIEGFVRDFAPQSRRIEFCLSGGRAVVRHGWHALPADCVAGPGDTELLFD